MKTTLLILSLILAAQAFATCPQQAKQAVSSYKKEITVSSATYKSFYPALKHYREEIQSDFKAAIHKSFVYIKGRKVTGHEIIISDGGDESTIRYVFNAQKKLVVAYWYNQSPMTYWFCGSPYSSESEYTEDETEI